MIYLSTIAIMKKVLFFLFFFILFGCNANDSQKLKEISLDCPRVYFSEEHSKYISSEKNDIAYNNISYKAELNNFSFSGKCYSQGNNVFFSLELLILIEPILVNNSKVEIPIYVILLDSNDSLIDLQYYLIEDNIKQDQEKKEYIITDIVEELDIISKTDNSVDNIIIGFMLDKFKIKLLN